MVSNHGLGVQYHDGRSLHWPLSACPNTKANARNAYNEYQDFYHNYLGRRPSALAEGGMAVPADGFKD